MVVESADKYFLDIDATLSGVCVLGLSGSTFASVDRTALFYLFQKNLSSA
jgi:hypothetical protein